jgi:hypothetical protein
LLAANAVLSKPVLFKPGLFKPGVATAGAVVRMRPTTWQAPRHRQAGRAMKTLILHLGLQKTGSTTVQETLRYNPAVLAAAGYDYASITWPDGVISSNHSFPLIVALSDGWQNNPEILRRGWTARGLKEHFAAQIDRALETERNLILSGEDITDLDGPGLAALNDLAQARGFAVKPVMLVRPPLEFITSMTQTRIRHGLGYHIFHAGKSRRITPCRALWPGMTCLPFAEAIRHPDGPLGLLLDCCGLPPAGAFNVIRQNDSMSEYATRIIGHVNNAIPLLQDGTVNPLRRYLDTEPLAAIPGPKFRLTRAEFLQTRPLVQSENAAFAEMLGPEFCDPDFQFNDRPLPWTEAALEALALAMQDLSPPLQEAIRSFFADPAQIGPEDSALARRFLG